MKQIKGYTLVSMATGLVFWALICVFPVSAADNNPCSEDIAKFCKNAAPNQIMGCLETNEKNLSAACKAHEFKMHGKRAERGEEVRAKKRFLQTCRADIAKFCKDADLKGIGYVKCINENKSELSASCAAWVAAQQEEKTK